MGNSMSITNSQLVWLVVSFLTVVDVCRAQTDAFTRQVTCPDNDTITGYTNIPDLNADMADELTRITTGGGTVPADGYTLRLCPNSDFDATNGAIRPVLGTLTIICGSGTTTANNEACIINSGQNQVVLDDSQVDGYTITDVSLQGVTFRNFGSRAVRMQASEPTTLTLQNVVWENFSNARALVEIEDTGTVRVVNGLVQSTTDPPDTNTDIAFFTNSGGGNLDVDGMQITNIRAQTGIFNNVNNGNTSLRGVAISGSTLDTNVARIEGGTMSIDTLTLSNNLRLDNVFFARNTGTSMTASNVNFLNNQSSEIFNGFNIGGGAVATIDSLTFESNTNVLYAITSQAQGGMSASVTVTGSRFANNQGIGTQLGNAPSALVSSFGNNAGSPTLSVSRADFDGNQNFVAAIAGQFGGDFRVTQACFSNSIADLVAYSDGSGTATSAVETNFIDPSYTITGPECTTEEAGRLLVEQASSGGCFSGQTNCVATCFPLASSDVCLSQVELSESPSLEPSLEPSLSLKPSRRDDSGAPSLVPSTAPTGFPTNIAIFDPTTTPSNVPSSEGDSNAPSTSERPSNAPTSFPTSRAEFEPTGGPTTSEATISASPTSTFDTMFPSMTFSPSLSFVPVAPTKPPTYRKDCIDGDDDDDDDDGKGNSGGDDDDDDDDDDGESKGRGAKRRKSSDCRVGKRKKKRKRKRLYFTSQTKKGKGGKTKIEKLQKKLKKDGLSKGSKSSKGSSRSRHDDYGDKSSKSDKKGTWD